MLAILGDLVAARTANPPGNESAAAEVVKRFFDLIPIPSRMHEKAPGRANILGRIGSGSPVLLVASHLDTVPAGEGWTSDPFTLRVEGNKAYARGANDNKGPLAASLLAARTLAADADKLRGTLIVAGVADEERGNEYGAKFLLSDVGLEVDYVIAPDCSGHMADLDVAEKGLVMVELECRGRAAHGSRPEDGVNAVVAMCALLEALSRAEIPSPPHAHFTPATMNIGTISGGTAANVVPERAVALVDFRVLPGTGVAEIEGLIDEVSAEVKARYPQAGFECRTREIFPPHEVSQDSALVEAVQAACQRTYGRRMKPLYQGGITIAKEFALAGVPSVGLGPGSPEAAHIADEWIEIDELVEFADFLVEVARLLLAE